MMRKFLSCALLFVLAGCCNCSNGEEDDLNTVPITNNPLIVPQGSQSTLPGMPSGSATR